MAFQTAWVVRRHMSKTGKFIEADSLDRFPGAVQLGPGEAVIGWYCNPAPWSECFVVFTDKAIYSVEGSAVTRIDIGEIVGYESPKSKADVTGVRVRTRAGFQFVRVAGTNGPSGKYKDAFSFITIVFKLAGRNEIESESQ